MPIEIRPYLQDDTEAVAEVMNYYIMHDAGLYTDVLLTQESVLTWIAERNSQRSPFLVAHDGQSLVGLAYARPFRSQSGSAHVWESSVYVNASFANRRSGIGTQLMQHLLHRLRESGVTEVMAVIDSENTASCAFHEKLGFHRLCTVQRAGLKFGKWRDAVLFQRSQ